MPLYGKIFEFDTLYESNLGGTARKLGHINLYQIGEMSCMSGFTVPRHEQWCHEISYVISGEGVFTTDDYTALLVAGDIHFCPCKSHHSITVSGNTDLRYGYIGFSFDDAVINDAEIARLREYYNSLKQYKATDNHNIQKTFFLCLDELYGKSIFSNTMINTYIIQLLVSIFRAFEAQPYTEYFPKLELSGSKRPVYLATRYIDQHIFEDLSVNEVAEGIGYNFSYLSNIFKMSTNLTVSQYISKMKIQKSIELMQNGKFSLAQVAERLNFASLQSFNRAFKRNMGVPPATFIKENFTK